MAMKKKKEEEVAHEEHRLYRVVRDAQRVCLLNVELYIDLLERGTIARHGICIQG